MWCPAPFRTSAHYRGAQRRSCKEKVGDTQDVGRHTTPDRHECGRCCRDDHTRARHGGTAPQASPELPLVGQRMTSQRKERGEGHGHRPARGEGGEPGVTGGDDPQPSVSLEDANGGKQDERRCPEGTITALLCLSRLIGLGNGDPPVCRSWTRRGGSAFTLMRARPLEDTCGAERVAVTHGPYEPISRSLVDLLEITRLVLPSTPRSAGSAHQRADLEVSWSGRRNGFEHTPITATSS